MTDGFPEEQRRATENAAAASSGISTPRPPAAALPNLGSPR